MARADNFRDLELRIQKRRREVGIECRSAGERDEVVEDDTVVGVRDDQILATCVYCGEWIRTKRDGSTDRSNVVDRTGAFDVELEVCADPKIGSQVQGEPLMQAAARSEEIPLNELHPSADLLRKAETEPYLV